MTPPVPRPQRLDRFGTVNRFVTEQLAPLTKETGTAAPGLVWLTLWSLANAKDGSVLFASVGRLRKLTGLSRNTVRRSLLALFAAGLLTVKQRGRIPIYSVPHVLAEG